MTPGSDLVLERSQARRFRVGLSGELRTSRAALGWGWMGGGLLKEVCNHLEAPEERRARAKAHGNETAEEMEDEGEQKLCANRAVFQKL